MLFVCDKTKVIFEQSKHGENKVKKVKYIALSTNQTQEGANIYYLNTQNKMPAHFALDDKYIVKYHYNTTNIFPVDVKWNDESKKYINYDTIKNGEQISELIPVQEKRLHNKVFDTYQAMTYVTLFYSSMTMDDLFIHLNNVNQDKAFHYVIDANSCYEIVEPDRECNGYKNHVSIVVLCKENTYQAIERASKFVIQVMNERNLYTYNFINAINQDDPNVFLEEDIKSIELRTQAYMDTSNGIENTESSASTKDDENVGNHMIHINMLFRSDKQFPEVEKQLIKFLAEYLFYFEIDTSSIVRLSDFIEKGVCLFYDDYNDFAKLLDKVNDALEKLKNGSQQVEVESTNLPEYDENGKLILKRFTKDLRDFSETTYFLTTSQKSINQDFDSITIGSNVEVRSKFEDASGVFTETVKLSSGYYEPIYPDLTVPPRNSTFLYNKGLLEPKAILKEMDQPTKPIVGKSVNLFDPYPTDNKIAQLEKHHPIVTLEYEEANNVNTNLFAYTLNRFGNTEKRLVALENILATQMRYLARLSSRISINCVYYGGQSPYNKYAAIRCMCDDLINDGAQVTLDQCLNCSRYEPVLGQIYEITGDIPGMAQIYDDVQASLMTKEEFASFNNIADYTKEKQIVKEDLSKLHLKHEKLYDFDTLLKNANNFVMNWTETPFHEQSPHISTYQYNPYEMYKDKQMILEDTYQDGFKEQEQLKFERPQYNMNTIGGGNFNPLTTSNVGINGFYQLSDYDTKTEDLRIVIRNICEEAISLGKNGSALYTLGAKIKKDYMQYTPTQLIRFVNEGKVVNDYTSGYESHREQDDKSLKAIYFDCSSFASYIYIHAGIVDSAFTTSSLPNTNGFKKIKDDNLTLLEHLKMAYPGDLILYEGHISIYAGGDEQWHASGDGGDNNRDLNKQVVKNKITNRSDFVCIYRHNKLSEPLLKGSLIVPIKVTLNDFAQMQIGKNTGKDTNNDGYIDIANDDHATLNDINILKNYINPNKRLLPDLKMQFASIRALQTNSIITPEMINNFFAKQKGKAMTLTKGIKCDNNWNPVRDENGELVWEEKYQFPRGEVWIEAGKRSGLNPLFLIAHCAGETGWCSANWTNYNGKFKSKDGKNHLFNAYGLWCYNSENYPKNPELHRATAKKECEARQWFTLEKAIIEGAEFIADRYLGASAIEKHGRRDTAYFMKWHMGNLIDGQKGSPCTMQYATDVSWADQRAKLIYTMLENAPVGREEALKHFQYFIPEFKA